MVRPPSTGQHRIEIRFIQDKSKRQVTFSKRRPTLLKSCSDLSLDFGGARVAVVVFSEAGKLFALGCPSVDAVLDDADADDSHVEALEDLRRAREAAAKQVVDEEVARMKAVGDKVVEAQSGRRFWWEADTEKLGPAELPGLAMALNRLKDKVLRYVDEKAISLCHTQVVRTRM